MSLINAKLAVCSVSQSSSVPMPGSVISLLALPSAQTVTKCCSVSDNLFYGDDVAASKATAKAPYAVRCCVGIDFMF